MASAAADALQMKIDIHTHILPHDWPDLDAKYGYGGFVRLEHYKPCCARMMIGDGVFREITDNVWEPKRRIEEMDRANVSIQVLSTVPVMFSYWAKPKDALDLSQLLNDHIGGIVRQYPTRFHGLGTIPLQDADLAASELKRCVRELGLRGAEIGTHVDANEYCHGAGCRNLDDKSLERRLENRGAAQRGDLRSSVGHDRQGADAEILVAVAGWNAGRKFAGDVLDDVRWRVRALSEATRRLRARRWRVSIHNRAHRARLLRAPGLGCDRQPNESTKLSRQWRYAGAVLR